MGNLLATVVVEFPSARLHTTQDEWSSVIRVIFAGCYRKGPLLAHDFLSALFCVELSSVMVGFLLLRCM